MPVRVIRKGRSRRIDCYYFVDAKGLLRSVSRLTASLGMTCCSHTYIWIELLHTLSKGKGVVVLCWDFSTPRIEICFPPLPIVEAFSTAIDDRYFTNGMAFIAYIPINSGVKSGCFGVFNQICAAGLPKYCFPIVQSPPTLRNFRPCLIAVYILRHLDVGQSLCAGFRIDQLRVSPPRFFSANRS